MSNRTEDLERILYKIIEELSKENAPIVFKGGLALKDLLTQSNKKNNIERKTVDIDANWTGIVNYDEMTQLFQKAIKRVDPTFKIAVSRFPKERQSMGYKILDENDNVITKIDLDIKDNPFYVICTVNNIDIKYSSFEKMMADKLRALSGEHVFRRTKDLLDIYLILQEVDIDFQKISEILKFEEKKLENFSTLLKNRKLLEESYDKLSGIVNKPPFDEVWKKDIEFLKMNNLVPKEWKEKDALEM